MLGNGSGARAHPFVAPCGTPSPRPRTDRTDSTRDMPGGHDNAHAGAGPTGITLNDLHVSPPRKATEMFSLVTDISAKSPIAQEGHDAWKLPASLLGFLLFHVSLFVIARFLVRCLNDALAGRDWLTLSVPAWHADPLLSDLLVSVCAFLLAAVLLLILAETGYLAKVMEDLPVKLPDRDHGQETFAKRVKPKSGDIHFGNLEVAYYVTAEALVVRSLSDRLVAVFGAWMIQSVKVAAETDERGWRGNLTTPAVVITLESAGYASKLVIHGAHFETPGMTAEQAKAKAEAFVAAVQAMINQRAT